MAKPLPLEVKDLSCLFGKMGMADSQAAERKERSEVVVRGLLDQKPVVLGRGLALCSRNFLPL